MVKQISNMSKICHGILLSIALILSSTGIAVAQIKSPQPPFDIEQFKPSSDNKTLYGDYRRKWNRLSGFELSSLHWNQFVAVFINQSEDVYRNNYIEYLRTSQDDWDDEDEDEEETETVSKFKPYPVGTIVVKEGFDSSQGKPGEALFISIMKKREKGFDTANGDWEYMQFDPRGKTMLKGKATKANVQAQCAGCHLNVADRDYVFSTFYTGKIDRLP